MYLLLINVFILFFYIYYSRYKEAVDYGYGVTELQLNTRAIKTWREQKTVLGKDYFITGRRSY